jgi:hypothetical protein
MPQNDNGVDSKVAGAKAALAHAESKGFPKMASPAPAAPKPSVPAMKSSNATALSDDPGAIRAHADAMHALLPKMHNGGPVAADGAYQLKAGEHVLTEPEAKIVRKHAMMAVGLKSLAKTPDGAGTPKSKMDKSGNASKKSTSGITVRPEKKQAAQVKQQMAR